MKKPNLNLRQIAFLSILLLLLAAPLLLSRLGKWNEIQASFVRKFPWLDINRALEPRWSVTETKEKKQIEELKSLVLPTEGLVLALNWGETGQKMVSEGVIDLPAFEKLYVRRGGLDKEMSAMLKEKDETGGIKITADNASVLLNIFWAFGLGNKNPILDDGPMVSPKYDGAGSFASTGGWSLSKGRAMDHYSKHEFVKLSPGQQAIVENVSKNIYRPCCDNSTYFPDCNHGMAMLGLIELLAANGQSEAEIYRTALQVNAYWFPTQYLTIAQYLKESGKNWADADPGEILGKEYSSGTGFAATSRKVKSLPTPGGGSCGV